MSLVWRKGPFSWIASLATSEVEESEYFPKSASPDNADIVALCKLLLGNAGEEVVVLFIEEDFCPIFIQEAAAISFKSIICDLGDAGECHSNSAHCWKRYPDELTLVTGYGLSEDGKWRRHSWLMDQKGSIIETTEERTKYFGFPLSKPQAEAFSSVYT